jgi:hypothetical protein
MSSSSSAAPAVEFSSLDEPVKKEKKEKKEASAFRSTAR